MLLAIQIVQFGNTKVEQDGEITLLIVSQHDIAGFYIAMNYAFLMGVRQSIAKLYEDFEDFNELQMLFFIYACLKGFPVHKFHDQEEIIAVQFAKIKNFGNIGMVEAARGPSLVLKTHYSCAVE